MEEHRKHALRRLVLTGDVVLVTLAMLLAHALHSSLVGVIDLLRPAPGEARLMLVGFVTLPVWLGVLALSGIDRILEQSHETGRWTLRLAQAQALATGGAVAAIWATQLVVNRSLAFLFVLFSFALLWSSRFLLASWARHQFSTGQGRARLLIVASEVESQKLAKGLGSGPQAPLIVGRLLPAGELSSAAHEPNPLGDLSRIEEVLHEQAVDVVLIGPPFERWEDAREVVERCEERGIAVEFVIPAADGGVRMPRVVRRYGLPVITYTPAPKPAEWLALKQLFDTTAAALGIVALTPLWLLVIMVLWATAGRPIFFSQERIGKNGRRFRMLKFRTMVVDAEAQKAALQHRNEAGGPVFKVGDDPRVTRVGKLLRRSSIDELPQLFNVLGGSMSLIGPRPLPVDEQQKIRGPRRRRLAMKPGITGLWQVSGRSNITFERWMDLDLQYVDEWRPSLDLVILLRTVPAVLFGRGAR